MICKYMNACTIYRTNVLSTGPVPDKYQREICATGYAKHCPIHGDLEDEAITLTREVMLESKVGLNLKRE